jgi:hypothetical protein
VQRVVGAESKIPRAFGSTRPNKEYPALPASRQGVTVGQLPTRPTDRQLEKAATRRNALRPQPQTEPTG